MAPFSALTLQGTIPHGHGDLLVEPGIIHVVGGGQKSGSSGVDSGHQRGIRLGRQGDPARLAWVDYYHVPRLVGLRVAQRVHGLGEIGPAGLKAAVEEAPAGPVNARPSGGNQDIMRQEDGNVGPVSTHRQKGQTTLCFHANCFRRKPDRHTADSGHAAFPDYAASRSTDCPMTGREHNPPAIRPVIPYMQPVGGVRGADADPAI